MAMLARRALCSALLAAALAGCTSTPPIAAQAAPVAPPKLLVFIVIDGLPMRQVLGYRDQLQPDGFRRFLDRGTWFANAHYGHAHTVTAAGHAVMLTGAYPQRSGIIANEWRDAKTGEQVYNTQDATAQYIDNPTKPMSGTSPRLLLAETVGDVLRTTNPASKVIGISGKDRGAILPAGHQGTAYMYMSDTGRFASSTYYMAAHPAWVTAFNAAKPADAYFGKSWASLLPGYDCPYAAAPQLPPPEGVRQAWGGPAPACAYARSVPDGQPWQSNSGNGNRLPAIVGNKMDGPGPRFYGNLLASPFGDELTLAFARAAIENEGLGADAVPDILSVSLSSHDYVNHAFGPESRLSHDHFLHLDRYLQGFFQYLDAKVGAGNYVAVLTADHGFADTPEWAKSQGRDAKRVASASLITFANAGLSQRFGEGKWVLYNSAMGFLFDEQLIAARGLKSADMYEAARQVLLTHPDVQTAFTAEQLRGTDNGAPFIEQVRKSWHPERSAPVQWLQKEGRLPSTSTSGSSHGSPYAYDSHVPLLAWGERWVGHGEVAQRVEIADLAPTLAGILHVRVPAQAMGKPLPLPLPLPLNP